MALTVREQMLQAAHEEAHPGRLCSTCPRVTQSLDQVARDNYTYVVVLIAAFTALVLLWIFL